MMRYSCCFRCLKHKLLGKFECVNNRPVYLPIYLRD
jgi:hypothetical protein